MSESVEKAGNRLKHELERLRAIVRGEAPSLLDDYDAGSIPEIDGEEAIKAWEAALSAIPAEGDVADSGFGGQTPELAEMLWTNLPVGQREWSSLPTHEKALVCHTVQRLLAPAHARIAELEARGDALAGALVDASASLAAAISLLERGGKAAKKAAPSDKMFDQMLVDYRASLKRARQAWESSR